VVTFFYSATPPAVAPPFARITSISVNYGDGSGDTGNTGSPGQQVSGSLTHVYSSPGSYTVTLSANASNGGFGSATTTVFITGGGGGGGTVSVSVSPSSTSVQVGQSVSFSYSATTSSVGIGFPTIRSMLISYGDGSAPLPLNPPSGVVQYSYSSPGTYTVLVTATDSNGNQGQATTFVQVSGGFVPPSFQPPSNVFILNAPSLAPVGQAVTFQAATAVVNNPGASIRSYSWSFGDGTTGFGQSVSHAFSSPGTYTITLTVTDSTGASAQNSTTISISPNAPLPPPPSVPGVTVTYQSGWNLVAGPTGSTINGASNPLYTWQSGFTSYQTAFTAQAGFGYWAFFTTPVTVTIPFTGVQSITKALQPSQFIMIGNSSSSPATVTGADIVYAYNPVSGYQPTTTLQPGQGAWALSFAGGLVTISSPGP
jgi:PKD repeat protein